MKQDGSGDFQHLKDKALETLINIPRIPDYSSQPIIYLPIDSAKENLLTASQLEEILLPYNAKTNLAMAKVAGQSYIDNLQLRAELGHDLTKNEWQRVLAYLKIKELTPKDVTSQNAAEIDEAARWAGWIPKRTSIAPYTSPIKNLTKVEFECSNCHTYVPPATLEYPDGRVTTAESEHRADCRDIRALAFENIQTIPKIPDDLSIIKKPYEPLEKKLIRGKPGFMMYRKKDPK